MGNNGKDEILVEASQSASALVDIKIKTLDSQTYTLRVDKCVPVPTLKEQVASLTGVVTEQQRLICRGKVMKDDQLLSAYHVEDGHTLHLAVRQPIQPLPESSTSNAAAAPAVSSGDSQGVQRSRVVVGSFDIAQRADGVYSDHGQIVSAVLGSLGIGIEGNNATGPLHERLSWASDPSTARDSSVGQFATPNAVDQTSTPLTSSQPAAIPDSLTTLSEYLNHLRQEFVANGSNANNLQDSANSMGIVQDSASTTGESRIPRPSHLAEVLQSTRQLLIGEVADCLANLSRLLVDHVNVTDPSTRILCQSNILQSGSLLENLGISLLELGCATMMLRLRQTPDDAVVNAGPAAFIGRSPLPLRSSLLGSSFGGLQAGTTHSNPFAEQSLASAPRNIEIRIRTGPWVPTSGTNQREESNTQQTPGQSFPSAPSSTTDSAPSTRGPSETPQSPVSLVIPVIAQYQQQLSSGERSSTGLEGVHQHVTESSRQPQNISTAEGEGDRISVPGIRRFSELRNIMRQCLRPLSHQEHQAGSSESNVAANPSATESTETNEAIANEQVEPATTMDEGNFISSVLRQIMPFISQNVASAREEGQDAEQGNSSRRPEPQSHPESKRQRRE